MERQIKAGVFRKLDRSLLTNWDNLDKEILERVALHDPGNEYAVNHMWGTDAIGYNVPIVVAGVTILPGDIIIAGSITKFSNEKKGGGGSIAGIGHLGISRAKSEVALTARLIDVNTVEAVEIVSGAAAQ